MYQQMCGIQPVEQAPGFRQIKLLPKPYGKLTYAKASLFSASGRIESGWEIKVDGELQFIFTIPFNTTATVVLPDALVTEVSIDGNVLGESPFEAVQQGEEVVVSLTAGSYVITYMPTKSYILTYSSENSLRELLSHEEASKHLKELFPELLENPIVMNRFIDSPLRELRYFPPMAKLVTQAKLEQFDQELVLIRQ
jgi:alpha-L-rhamnosidase